MYSDLLDVLGGQGGGNGGGGGSGGRNGNNETHTAVSFKAGKMDMALQENGKYLVTANPIRGEIRMVYHKNLDSGSTNSSEGEMKWEFFDRRAKSTVDSIKIEAPTPTASDASASTSTATLRSSFERVETGKDTDRVYLWTTESDERRMFWMQEGTDENDDTHVAQVNQFLTNPQDANPNSNSTDAGAGSGTGGGSGGDGDGNTSRVASLDPEALLQVMQGGGATTTGEDGGSGSGTQVDALSNILENLGMPQPMMTTSTTGTEVTPPTTATTATTTAAATDAAAAPTGTGTLTLADLQGAMAGLATSTPPATPPTTMTVGPPLQELVSGAVVADSSAMEALLQDDALVARLYELLPEQQRTKQHLEDTLKSPQVAQTLQSLTSALLPDENGSLDGYHSVIANFRLDPKDGETALFQGNNPIQGFLDCVLASVEKGKKKTDEDGDKKKEGDATMEKE